MRRDAVRPDVHAAVIVRDKACVLSFLERGHECRDIFGDRHRPDAIERLTLEHVKDELRMGVRAPSDVKHLVLLCGYTNNQPPSKVQRAAMREYLAGVA